MHRSQLLVLELYPVGQAVPSGVQARSLEIVVQFATLPKSCWAPAGSHSNKRLQTASDTFLHSEMGSEPPQAEMAAARRTANDVRCMRNPRFPRETRDVNSHCAISRGGWLSGCHWQR